MSSEARRPEDQKTNEGDEALDSTVEHPVGPGPVSEDDVLDAANDEDTAGPIDADGDLSAPGRGANATRLVEPREGGGPVVLRRGQEAFSSAPPPRSGFLAEAPKSTREKSFESDSEPTEMAEVTEMVDETRLEDWSGPQGSDPASAGHGPSAAAADSGASPERQANEDVYVILPPTEEDGATDAFDSGRLSESLNDDALSGYGDAGDWDQGATEVVDDSWFDSDGDRQSDTVIAGARGDATAVFEGDATEYVDEDALEELTTQLDEDLLESGSGRAGSSAKGFQGPDDGFGGISDAFEESAPRSRVAVVVGWAMSIAALTAVGFFGWTFFGPEQTGSAIGARGLPGGSTQETPVVTIEPSEADVLVEVLDAADENAEVRQAEEVARELARARIALSLKLGFSGVGDE